MYMINILHQKPLKKYKNASPKTLHIICKLPPVGGRPFSSMRMWREESGFTPSVLVGLTAGIHLRFGRMGINPHRFCCLSVGKGGDSLLGTTKRMDMFPKIQGAFCEEESGRIFWFPDYSDPVSSCHWLPATSLKASPETTRKNTAFFPLIWALGRFHQDGEILDGHLNTVTMWWKVNQFLPASMFVFWGKIFRAHNFK